MFGIKFQIIPTVDISISCHLF